MIDVDIDKASTEWLLSEINELTSEIEHKGPIEYIEENRYLKRGQTIMPGPFRFEVTPYWKKPFSQVDPYDPTREIFVKKGVKTSFTTSMIENTSLYYAEHVKATPMGYVTADKELAISRLNQKIVTMFQQSGFKDIFKSSDEQSHGKTGKTKNMLEFVGGSSLQAEGAKNADKMRDYQWFVELLDEIDTYATNIGGEGDPLELLFSRCDANWAFRKIIGGSTPLLKGSSHIDRMFKRGNRQVYKCRCLKCGLPMPLRWFHDDINTPGITRGMRWDYIEGTEIHDPLSVRYECWNCGCPHLEAQKPIFICDDNSEWVATTPPVAEGIESYHMPAALSSFKRWTDHVVTWHKAFNPQGKVKSHTAMQVFYNNVLGEVFEQVGFKLKAEAAYSHRRDFYHKTEIANEQISKYCESGILFLCMTVDVQLHFLSVAIWGITAGGTTWVIDYKTLKDASEAGCLDIDSPSWCEVRRLIDEEEWVSDDKKVYRPVITLIDCGWAESESVVTDFCSEWTDSVYPIKGDSQSAKRISSFREYKTSEKHLAYMIAVDHYKDRLAPVLRRRWRPEDGNQQRYHFNAPVDIKNEELKELTVEFKKQEKDKNGNVVSKWWRRPGSRNELWDLLVYANAAVEIFAYIICRGNFELDETDWGEFWERAEEEGLFFEQE